MHRILQGIAPAALAAALAFAACGEGLIHGQNEEAADCQVPCLAYRSCTNAEEQQRECEKLCKETGEEARGDIASCLQAVGASCQPVSNCGQ